MERLIKFVFPLDNKTTIFYEEVKKCSLSVYRIITNFFLKKKFAGKIVYQIIRYEEVKYSSLSVYQIITIFFFSKKSIS